MDQVAILFVGAQTDHRAGRLDDAVVGYENILTLQPNNAAALTCLGLALCELGRVAEAIVQHERALRLSPNSVETLVNLGIAFYKKGDADKATETLKKALRSRPNCVEAWTNLGNVLRMQGKMEEAAAKYIGALRLSPSYAEAMINLGAVRYEQHRFEEALALYEKVLDADPGRVDVLWSKATTLLTLGRYKEGWKLYKSGLGHWHLRGHRTLSTKPWNGAPAPRKTLLIWSEQGFGDALQFVRYAALCKKRVDKVFVQCPHPLLRLFKNCPYIDGAFEIADECKYDEHIAMMSLPHVLGTELDTVPAEVPYLFVTPAAREKWAIKFCEQDEKWKIGLVWAGSVLVGKLDANVTDRRRSISLKQMLPLFEITNAHFYSLQMGDPAKQIDKNRVRDRITDYTAEIGDFMDTAAIIENLDLVITVDTSVAHLAGALGKPVWILSRYDADWRWLQNREVSPWYPTARIFGQPSFGDWASVLTDVRNALRVTCKTGK